MQLHCVSRWAVYILLVFLKQIVTYESLFRPAPKILLLSFWIWYSDVRREWRISQSREQGNAYTTNNEYVSVIIIVSNCQKYNLTSRERMPGFRLLKVLISLYDSQIKKSIVSPSSSAHPLSPSIFCSLCGLYAPSSQVLALELQYVIVLVWENTNLLLEDVATSLTQLYCVKSKRGQENYPNITE